MGRRMAATISAAVPVLCRLGDGSWVSAVHGSPARMSPSWGKITTPVSRSACPTSLAWLATRVAPPSCTSTIWRAMVREMGAPEPSASREGISTKSLGWSTTPSSRSTASPDR